MFEESPSFRLAASKRNAELASGGAAIEMPAGPKWACQVLPEFSGSFDLLSSSQWLSAMALFLQLRPINIQLDHCSPVSAGILAHSTPDDNGLIHAYALFYPDRRIEMVGVLPTGIWPPQHQAWWPGVYEKPFLQQISSVLVPLISVLQLPGPVHLFISLLSLENSALIAKGPHGSEQAYPIPSGSNFIGLDPILVDGFDHNMMAALVQAFDQVRARAGVIFPHAFYL
ncbi:hypothetical protein QU481_17715 [Crenobacter sp. SG2303]|uniref:Uncharacterized protein n=1 Tax=Crenobacter oryzisoli TaxID=3056844 RepID=A0ABT7XSD1_9NEIS|nr:hypothetical protein [Crenobacter sp. SG2303]MDN0076699.1 hypothetical protein [Crenobacter sp. SG2303]